MKKIGLIPARKGSKGIKNKNITKINGKPLISYTIEAAINTNLFDQIIVSSNDKNVKDICQKYGVWSICGLKFSKKMKVDQIQTRGNLPLE